jgi:excisionase family DNA binding protein
MANQKQNLYTRKEVATLAKVCVHTIARDVRAGRLEEIRFNRRRLRYHSDAVDAYLAANYRFGRSSPGSSNTEEARNQPRRKCQWPHSGGRILDQS